MPGPGPDAPLRLPPKCHGCLDLRVAWTRPRVDLCYQCLPGGPFIPPPCTACNSTVDYFSQGLCGRCHPHSPEHIDSCKGCLAWGVYPKYNWTCWSCRTWRTHHPEGTCKFCGRVSRIGELNACRLCYEQARMLHEPGRPLDLAGANAHGQQLFFANLTYKRLKNPRPETAPWRRVDKNYLPYPAGTGFDDNAWIQEPLFDAQPDPEAVRARARTEDSDLTRYCVAIVNDHAKRYGWSVRQRTAVIQSLRILQTLRPTPTAKIHASDVIGLRRYDGTITSTLEVLTEAGLLIEDVPTRVEKFLAAKTHSLPPAMRQHLELWMQVMIGGSRQAPRLMPRDPGTVEFYLRGIAPIVQTWAEAGHQSFAEITSDQIRTALATITQPRTGRYGAELGLKSLFRTLKGRRLIFADPTRGLKPTPVASNIPLPLDPALIRAELNSPNPAVAVAVALVAFHGLGRGHLRQLKLTDIADGRLTINSRNIPLAAPVRTRLAAWLDYRNQTWPSTANPHLLINRKTAPRLLPVGRAFPWIHSALGARALREDRILHEIHATGGDVRRICDLFGYTVAGATRYLNTIEHTDLTNEAPQVPRT